MAVMTEKSADATAIRRVRIDLPQEELDDPSADPTAHGGSAEDASPLRDPVDGALRVLRKADDDRQGPGPRRARPGRTEQAYPNLICFNEVEKGNHFAAWQEPELF